MIGTGVIGATVAHRLAEKGVKVILLILGQPGNPLLQPFRPERFSAA